MAGRDIEPADLAAAMPDGEIVDLARRLVSIPSYTTEEAELAEFIADVLNDHRVEVGLQRVPLDGLLRSAARKSYNVIARVRGTGGGRSLLFNGHMDHGPLEGRSVDDLSRWARAPFAGVVEDGYLYGKGAQDEKGGITAMLAAAVLLRRLQPGLRGDVVVTPVCAHKSHSTGTKHLMASGLRADMAINTENSGNAVVPTHVGVVTAQVHLVGAHPHPTQRRRFPALQARPSPFRVVEMLLDALGPEATPYGEASWLRFTRHPDLDGFPWHHVDRVETRGFLGKIVHLWFHTPPGVTAAGLKADLERLLDRLRRDAPGCGGRVDEQSYGDGLETPPAEPVVQALVAAHTAVRGEAPRVGAEARYGLYGDASVLSAHGIPSVVYGPGGGLSDLEHEWQVIQGERSPDERIALEQIVTAARVYARAALEVSR
jgi:acetylornithine deacetylase